MKEIVIQIVKKIIVQIQILKKIFVQIQIQVI